MNERRTESPRELRAQLEDVRHRLAEAEETLRAIREGDVDAVVVSGTRGDQILTLDQGEDAYRLTVETMNEAGIVVAPDGTILFANKALAGMLGVPLEQVVGKPFALHVHDRQGLDSLLRAARQCPTDARLVLNGTDGESIPVYAWASLLDQPDGAAVLLLGAGPARLEAPREMIKHLQAQRQALAASVAALREAETKTHSLIQFTASKALTSDRLHQQVGRLRQELEGQFRMVGDSPELQRVQSLIARVAPTAASVLVTGESGVGKELVARAVHLRSPRAGEPFVALNCAAIPQELIESELFGHEKGAFTNAGAARAGKIQEADGGTLFLDEIGDLSLPAQAKLLRFLNDSEVQRVGGSGVIHLDVRIVAATNKDLPEIIKHGVFRDDFYHRLNVVTIEVPPLRERMSDIELLATFFLDRYCADYGRIVRFAPESWHALKEYAWPGNVRELRNLVERVVILAETNPVEAEELRSFLGAEAKVPTDGTLKEALERAEREAVERVLVQTNHNVAEAAAILGIVRPSLYRIIKRYGIASPSRAQTKD
ncbi:sigma 54-interacting transcriptional regulator [candidate division WOR-3 bacterium]|nr:sigma 54-interacting transcriptional regulator [candidate division WOR-3 bacterium]